MFRCMLAVLASCGALLTLAAPALGRGHLDSSFGDRGIVDLTARPGNEPSASLGVMRVGPERGSSSPKKPQRAREAAAPTGST
jgi:hypothetical protein